MPTLIVATKMQLLPSSFDIDRLAQFIFIGKCLITKELPIVFVCKVAHNLKIVKLILVDRDKRIKVCEPKPTMLQTSSNSRATLKILFISIWELGIANICLERKATLGCNLACLPTKPKVILCHH
jgi:hypothetical protein